MRILCLTAATIATLVSERATAQSSMPRSHADSITLTTAMYRAAFVNGMRTAHALEKPTLVCVAAATGDPPAAIVRALADSTSLLVRPKSACRVEPLTSPSTGMSLVVDTLTGRRGIVITVDRLTFDMTGGFTFHTTYYENGRSAANWECTGRRTGARWEVLSCRMTSIS